MSRERTTPRSSGAEGASFDEAEVAQLLATAARAVPAEVPPAAPRLSLGELERIAIEAGLDPARVRTAALRLEATRGASTQVGLLGGPLRPAIVRQLPALDEAALDRVVERLRAAARQPGRLRRAPGLVELSFERSSTPTVVKLCRTDAGTEVTLRAELTGAAGGLFGGLLGGLGGGLGGGFAFFAGAGLAGVALLLGADPRGTTLPALAVLGGLGWAAACVVGAGLLARRLFGAHAGKALARLSRLVDALPEP